MHHCPCFQCNIGRLSRVRSPVMQASPSPRRSLPSPNSRSRSGSPPRRVCRCRPAVLYSSDEDERADDRQASVPSVEAVNLSDGDPNVTVNDVSTTQCQYRILSSGTIKGNPTLLGPHGHTYCVKQRRAGATYWRCCVRSTSISCPATVIERDGNFTSGSRPHSHATLPSS